MFRFSDMKAMSHDLLSRRIRPGDLVVDATVGQGYDTLMLANAVGDDGLVVGFDVQAAAIAATQQRLLAQGVAERVVLHLASHAEADHLLPGGRTVRAAVFNLGYLPGSDLTVTTVAESTLAALRALLARMDEGSLIVLALYPGHPQGAIECAALDAFARDLPPDIHVMRYQRVNNRNPAPYLLILDICSALMT